MTRQLLLGAVLLSCLLPSLLALAPSAAQPIAPRKNRNLSFLENDSIRLGVDLDRGGCIAYLADPSRGGNVINVSDTGRLVQPSFYSGPRPFGNPAPHLKNWFWNPVGAGDVYDHPARVLKRSNDGKTLYVKSVPMQWALNNFPGDCTFETWIRLEDNAAQVRHRLTNARRDHAQYPAENQELPAVYTIAQLSHLLTYDGLAPFTNDRLREIPQAGPPSWASWYASENWAAHVDADGWGVGVFHPGVYSFVGGLYGRPRGGGPYDDATGYMGPNRKEILDYNIVYEYEYALILGSLKEIRRYAYAHRPRDTRPDYHFKTDRQHWTYINAKDTGYPIRGQLRVLMETDDPQMIGPDGLWAAKDVPKIYIEAAWHSKQDLAEVFWSVPGKAGFSQERKVSFTVKPDGRFHLYEVDLASSPAYKGPITSLRFDPVPAGGPEEYIDVRSISWKVD